MPWDVRLSARAEKESARLPRTEGAVILSAPRWLSADLAALDVKKLAGGGNRWRLRVRR